MEVLFIKNVLYSDYGIININSGVPNNKQIVDQYRCMFKIYNNYDK